MLVSDTHSQKQWCMHVLEVIFLIMREQVSYSWVSRESHMISGSLCLLQSAATLARTDKGCSEAERRRDEE